VKLAVRAKDDLDWPDAWRGGAPLWKTLPTRDEAGKHLTDFMMFAPGLKRQSPEEVRRVLGLIKGLLEQFPEEVVFADFNLSLNLLWVSLRCQPGAMSMLVVALRARVPALKLVGHNPLDRML